jgi:hypothetical protein
MQIFTSGRLVFGESKYSAVWIQHIRLWLRATIYPDLIKLDFASMGLHPFILYGTQTWNPKNQLEDCHVWFSPSPEHPSDSR